jgi:hypothetical protein
MKLNYRGLEIEKYVIKFTGRVIYRIKGDIGSWGFSVREVKDIIDRRFKWGTLK